MEHENLMLSLVCNPQKLSAKLQQNHKISGSLPRILFYAAVYQSQNDLPEKRQLIFQKT